MRFVQPAALGLMLLLSGCMVNINTPEHQADKPATTTVAPTAPRHLSLSLSSASAIRNCDQTPQPSNFCKDYTIASVSPFTNYTDFRVFLDSTDLGEVNGKACGLAAVPEWSACVGPAARKPMDTMTAGDLIVIHGPIPAEGRQLRFTQKETGSDVLTLTIR